MIPELSTPSEQNRPASKQMLLAYIVLALICTMDTGTSAQPVEFSFEQAYQYAMLGMIAIGMQEEASGLLRSKNIRTKHLDHEITIANATAFGLFFVKRFGLPESYLPTLSVLCVLCVEEVLQKRSKKTSDNNINIK